MFQQLVHAPSLKGGLAWFNTDRPLRFDQELRGHVVLLDFWTYCCINCMHVILDLKKLEAKYPNELAVIGVHSAKFANEKETGNIRNAILRYGIEHPVVNDADFNIWRAYGTRAWPSLVILDPEGQVIGALSGEGHYDLLDETISRLIVKHADRLNREPLRVALESEKTPPSVLAFPGKVLADEGGGRLFIADSGHNRVLISDLNGRVQTVIGTGSEGLEDGHFADAEFRKPQGLLLAGDYLYVADTENHAIRRLDLSSQTVKTVVGDGVQSRSRQGGVASKTRLASPWALERVGDRQEIFIAMAGTHQLWVYDPGNESVEPSIGSGREGITDGAPGDAALAQPSGLASDGTNLYFADSEVSALRLVENVHGGARVETLIGTGLFDFGDRDGAFEGALLQHALGVTYRDGEVYIADSYNHKVKVADLDAGTLTTFVGTGEPGVGSVDAPQFNEPGGLSIADGRLYIADTNNNAIRVVDLTSRKTTTLILDFSGIPVKDGPPEFAVFGNPERIDLSGKPLAVGGTVELAFEFPPTYHLNPMMKPGLQFRVSGEDGDVWVSAPFEPDVEGESIRFPVELGNVRKPKKIEASITFYYCRESNEGACYIGSALIEGPLNGGADVLKLRQRVHAER